MLLGMLQRRWGIIVMNRTVRFVVVINFRVMGHLMHQRPIIGGQGRTTWHGAAIQGQAQQPQKKDKSMQGIYQVDLGKL